MRLTEPLEFLPLEIFMAFQSPFSAVHYTCAFTVEDIAAVKMLPAAMGFQKFPCPPEICTRGCLNSITTGARLRHVAVQILPAAEILRELSYEGFFTKILHAKIGCETRCCALAASLQERASMTLRSCQWKSLCVFRICSIMDRLSKAVTSSRQISLLLCSTKRLHNITLFFFELISTLHT